MKLYQIYLFCLLFAYISSACKTLSASGLDSCSSLELSDQEKSSGGVVCCFVQVTGTFSANGCDIADQGTYDKVLKGTTQFTDEYGTSTYTCPLKTEETTKANNSGINYLTLGLVHFIFFSLLI